MEFIKVKDNEHLIKNTKSNFIVNTNKSEYDEYIARRKLKQSEKQKVENVLKNLTLLSEKKHKKE